MKKKYVAIYFGGRGNGVVTYCGGSKEAGKESLRAQGCGKISILDSQGFCAVYRGPGLEARRGQVALTYSDWAVGEAVPA